MARTFEYIEAAVAPLFKKGNFLQDPQPWLWRCQCNSLFWDGTSNSNLHIFWASRFRISNSIYGGCLGQTTFISSQVLKFPVVILQFGCGIICLAIKFSMHNRCLKYLTLQTFPWESFLTCFLAAELLSTLITQSRHSNIKKEAPILIVLVPKSYEWRSVYLTAKVFFPEIRKTCWKCHRGFDVYNIV